MTAAAVVPADLRPWLDRVRLCAGSRLCGRGEGGRAARAAGFGLDLHGHRNYQPGDELRHLDWHALARLGALVVREYRAEAAPTLALLIDTSGSMSVGAPSKMASARRLAAALGYLALREQGRVALGVFGERGRWVLPPVRGLGRLAELHERLGSLAAAGPTDLRGSWTALAGGLARVDLAVVVSDFLVEGLDVASVAALGLPGAAVVLLQVLERDEVDPPEEEAELDDVERRPGSSIAGLRVDASVVEAYRAAFLRQAARLDAVARSRRCRCVTLLADDPPGHWLAAWLAAGIVAPRAA